MLLEKLKESVKLAKKDIVLFGKSHALRHGLGAERCVQWRVMSHLERLLPKKYQQIPEAYLASDNLHDLGVFIDLSIPLSPVMLVEFKITTFYNLFQGTKQEVKKDFTKLMKTMRIIEKQKGKVLPLVGLVIYLEDKLKEGTEYRFFAQKADKKLYDSSTKFLGNYFEIIIREVEDDILFNPPLKKI